MKLLIALGIVQTVCILVLIAMIATSHTDTPPVAAATSGTSALAQNESSRAAESLRSPDEARLRQIIREEFAAQHAADTQPNNAIEKAATNLDLRTVEQFRNQRNLVAQHIETYKSVGVITDSQMNELQGEIADLDEPGRKETMSLLIRALNSGRLKGHL
jgi:hypothetical protein